MPMSVASSSKRPNYDSTSGSMNAGKHKIQRRSIISSVISRAMFEVEGKKTIIIYMPSFTIAYENSTYVRYYAKV